MKEHKEALSTSDQSGSWEVSLEWCILYHSTLNDFVYMLMIALFICFERSGGPTSNILKIFIPTGGLYCDKL